MRTIKIIALIAFTVFIGSCKEKMDIELTGTYTRLIVNGKITTTDTIQSVKLTKSADYFNNKPVEPVSDALVTISDGENTYSLFEKVNKSGMYETTQPLKGIPGKTYTLNIKNANVGNGVTEYWASSYLPNVCKIDSIYLMPITKSDFSPPGSQFALKAYITDPGATQDNYLFHLNINGKNLTDTINKLSFTSDEYSNGKHTWTLPFFIRYDYMGAGSAGDYSSINVIDSLKKGDIIILEMDGITKDYLSFLSQMLIQGQGSSPFSGPPANVSTNVYPKENAVGFFAAYSIEKCSIVL